MAEVIAAEKKGSVLRLALKANEITKDARVGDSIAVNGVCLTLVEIQGNVMKFDLSDETLRATTHGQLKLGDRVNLEPSLRPDSKLGGHFVSGHVDGTGRIRSKKDLGNVLEIEIEATENIIRFLVEKGSVAVDGISLTVVHVLKNSFTVVIIPHTARITTIGLKGPGDPVNIEVDIIGKYVARFLGRENDRDSKLMQTLMEGGFLK